MNFLNPYSRSEYKKFFQDSLLTDNFRIIEEEILLEFKPQFINKAELIGRDNSLELEVYEVQHNSENDPRVGISKDFFRLMANYGSKRALAIFYSPNSKNYRLSLATVDLSLEGSKVKREYSNPRRYSFFLGPDAKVHTPYDFLIKKGRVKDFDDLQNRFSIEVVNKEFYKEIANWYFWTLKKVKFPADAEAEKNGREISVIRLITRIIFIWFMKVRKLVPEELFNENALNEILTDLKLNNDNYYKAILQNLFFATLNTKQGERRFTSKKKGYKGYSHDFGNHNVYRYEEFFKDSEEAIEKYFMPIPFLNGGLFECLDYKTKAKDERKYTDGFTSTKLHQPVVPNFLFFSDDKTLDLNKDYGTTNKKYNVRGLIDTLSLYNFTIDESDPNDADVALDPELLGKVFENLLASYNPETAKTARKSTGSYYTPRPIVDYMVDESLKQYFKTHIQGAEGADSILAVGGKDCFLDPNDEIDIHQGNLPHWQQENVWYFITFRLADSLPRETVEQIKKERELWFSKHSHKKEENQPYSIEELKEYYRLFSERIESLLDDCRGSCILREENIAKIIADAFLHFNNERYVLDDWVIMPNHVHLLVKPVKGFTIPQLTHSWKSYTANVINKTIGGSGQLWLHESYDHIVRNESSFFAIKNYIRNNPVKAHIRLTDCAQSWTNNSSAVKSKAVESKDALDTQLDILFSSEDQSNPFDTVETKKLVNLIDSLRVVDPAVGSGAFPMRILNRLVFLLHKLDSDNSLWKQSQIDGIKKSVKDPTLQRKFIEETERKFKEKNPDYGRKLYLIEKCIYGVDIQQIAVEIAKLRFFISLLVDEKVENGEIEPLPNLDFKLMQGNSLISSFAGIDFSNKPQNNDSLFDFDEKYKLLIAEFDELKSQYQNEPDVKKKNELREKIDKKLLEVFEEKLKQHYPQLNELESKYSGRKEIIEAEKKKLFKKIGIDVDQAEQDLIAYTEGRKQKNFFLWDVYFAEVFAEKSGFDIVIGNPPYGILNKKQNKAESIIVTDEELNYYKNNEYYQPAGGGMINIFRIFILRSIRLLTRDGIFAEIFPLAFIGDLSIKRLRKFILDNHQIISVDAFPERDNTNKRVFEAVKMSVCILHLINKKDDKPFFIRIHNDRYINSFSEKNILTKSLIAILDKESYTFPLTSINETKLLVKIFSKAKRFSEIGKCNTGEIDMTFCKAAFTNDHTKSVLLKGAIIDRYILRKRMSQGEIVYIDEKKMSKIKPVEKSLKNMERIVLQGITGVNENTRLKMMLVNNAYCANSLNYLSFKKEISKKYLLGILNSKLLNFVFRCFSTNSNVNGYEVDNLPLIIPSNHIITKQLELEVDHILAVKKQNPEANTQHLEDQIDIMVYKLYNLTYEEVKIIDPQIGSIINKEDYDKFEIQ
ncbi:MAG: hypothetical protein B6D44_06140 [Ignavibacteriales bacterium UTCHB2]|jgi:Alw26I/Eco31I/Esp3I family type II restriction m6 adenine DNA methyltransferase|nr:MAG: hypothetical protein B6D44_06140 [Ignavibacteriales bacterium UTCHB2]